MTIVAFVTPNEVPCLIGDLLLSGLQAPNTEVSIPGVGDVTDFFGDCGWGVVGLRQKLAVVADNCAVGWAGGMVGAMAAISELREIGRRETLTRQKVYDFLDAHPDALSHDTSFVGMVWEKDEGVRGFTVRGVRGSLGRLGQEALLAGSGAEMFAAVAQRALDSGQGDGNATKLDVAYSTLQQHAAQLLAAEANAGYSAETIQNLFGGGYEVVLPRRGGIFLKADQHTTVVWSAVPLDGDDVALRPEYIVKQAYERDYLILKSARIDPETLLAHRRLDVISPIYATEYRRPRHDQFPQMTYASPMVTQIVLCRLEEVTRVLVQFDRQVPGSETIRIQEDGAGHIAIDLHQRFLAEMKRGIRAYRTC